MTNGYIVLTKGEPNLYKHAAAAIDLGKPVYYADGNKVAFVNSIELVSTDVVIKTSDKQITVTSNGSATEVEKGLYRYYATLQDDSNVKVTIFFNTTELLAEDLTFNDIEEHIIVGDYGQTGILGDSAENIAYVCDHSFDNQIQISYSDLANSGMLESDFKTLVTYGLIAKIA